MRGEGLNTSFRVGLGVLGLQKKSRDFGTLIVWKCRVISFIKAQLLSRDL